ncbi:MAG: hypothetical protein ACI351_00855 [Candidatus Avelusimicrobium sp.]|uniref:hypothetical protein n=1 Tax=Candidatus Avelusimicrobium sp. TaxID=3048833 RepID=UPI003F08FF00
MSLETSLQACFKHTEGAAFVYFIPENFPAFEGHFPNNPLLPAVCQISLCADAASRQTGKRLEVKSVARAKFMRPLLPRTYLHLTLTPRADGKTLCELAEPKDGQKFSQMILSFQERDK